MKKVLITALVVLSLVLAVSCTTNYTVKFEANGGTPAPAAQTVAAGGVVVEPVSPAKEGYTFKGWYTDSTCATKYNFDTKVQKSFTLYAGYDKNVEPVKKTYTVTFNSNGGSEVPSQTVTEGECAVRPLNPTKAGYEFVDWYTAIGLEAGIAYSFTSKVESDLTLIAKWVDEAGAIVVSFEANGGVDAPGKQGADAAFYVVKPVDPALPGANFVGWFTDKNCTTPFYLIDGSFNCFKGGANAVKISESMVLYAGYVDSGEFTIDENGILTGINASAYPTSTTTSITIPEGVTAIADGSEVGGNVSGVFVGYTSLKTIVIPSTLKYIGDYAFWNCPIERVLKYEDVVKGIEYSEFSVPYVTEIGDCALQGTCGSGNYKVESATFEELVVLRGYGPFGANTTIKSIYAPKVKMIGSIDASGSGAVCDLSYTSSLKTLNLPLIKGDDQFIGKLKVSATAPNVYVAADAEITSGNIYCGTKTAVETIRADENGKIHVATVAELTKALGIEGAYIVLDNSIILAGNVPVSGKNITLDLSDCELGNQSYNLTLASKELNFRVLVYNVTQFNEVKSIDKATMVLEADLSIEGSVTGGAAGNEDALVYPIKCSIDGNEKTLTIRNTLGTASGASTADKENKWKNGSCGLIFSDASYDTVEVYDLTIRSTGFAYAVVFDRDLTKSKTVILEDVIVSSNGVAVTAGEYYRATGTTTLDVYNCDFSSSFNANGKQEKTSYWWKGADQDTTYVYYAATALAVQQGTTANIYSGRFTNKSGYAAFIFTGEGTNAAGGTINIYGGTFDGGSGDFNGKSYGAALMLGRPEDDTSKAMINVSGGTISGSVGDFKEPADSVNTEINVTKNNAGIPDFTGVSLFSPAAKTAATGKVCGGKFQSGFFSKTVDTTPSAAGGEIANYYAVLLGTNYEQKTDGTVGLK